MPRQSTRNVTHLELVAADERLLAAENESESSLAELLGGARVFAWPPEGGEWDNGSINFFAARLADASGERRNSLLAWGPYYVLEGAGSQRSLVASAGFFGPPDEAGAVEIGYSVVAPERRRGIATAVIEKLCALSFECGATQVRARTASENVGSIGALTKAGFVQTTNHGAQLRFDRKR